MLLMTLAPSVVEAPSLDDGPLRLTDQTAAEIETMAVLYEAVELHIEAQLGQAIDGQVAFPLTETNISTVATMKAYAASLRKELQRRRSRRIPDNLTPNEFYLGRPEGYHRRSPPVGVVFEDPSPRERLAAEGGGGSEFGSSFTGSAVEGFELWTDDPELQGGYRCDFMNELCGVWYYPQ